jgi:AcrR family transcriptional regulator
MAMAASIKQKARRGSRVSALQVKPITVHTSVKNEIKVQDRRAILVATATKIFMKKGFDAATVREIGEAAGLTQGTIYNYIRSKDDILYLVCDEAISAYQDAVRKALANTDQDHRLQNSIEAFIDVIQQHQDHILLVYQVTRRLNRSAMQAILAKVTEFNALAGQILTASLGKNIGGLNKVLAMNILTFLPSIIALRRWDLGGKVSPADIKSGLTLFLMRGFGSPPHTKERRDSARHRTRR